MINTINKKTTLLAITLLATAFPFQSYALLQEGVSAPINTQGIQVPVTVNTQNPAIQAIPGSVAPQAAQESNIGFSDEDKITTGNLSRSATKLQLSATEEKMRAQYLKNKLDRIKLEHELGSEALSGSGRLTQTAMPQAPSLMMPYLPSAAPSAINNQSAPKETPSEKKASTNKMPASLLEVTGVGQELVARIQVNGTVKNYVKGDKVNGLIINNISAKHVMLSNGSHIDL